MSVAHSATPQAGTSGATRRPSPAVARHPPVARPSPVARLSARRPSPIAVALGPWPRRPSSRWPSPPASPIARRPSAVSTRNASGTRSPKAAPEAGTRSPKEAMLKAELRNMERSQKREGIDMTYLKNVILKLLEIREIGALLPVVATLLQFSPDELKKCQQGVLSSVISSQPPAVPDGASTPNSFFARFSF